MPSAAQFPHGCPCPEQTLDGDRAKRDKDLRLNNFDLLDQIRPACLHFERRRWPVAKRASWRIRTAFQDIGNVNFLANEAHRLDNSREQLTCAPDKWLALPVLVHARRFTDEHQFRIRTPDAEDCLRPRTGEMRAFCANADAFANRRQQFCFVRRARRSALRPCQWHGSFQAAKRYFRRAGQVIIRLANLFQRRDNKIKSRVPHLKPSSKILRSAANSFLVIARDHAVGRDREWSGNDEARLSDYDYDLPRELIAQRPVEHRADSRMMVLRRDAQTIEHRQFRELKTFLQPGDLLVLNDTRGPACATILQRWRD